VTQKLDAQGAATALRTSPKDAALHSHLAKRYVATGTDEFLKHRRRVDWNWPGMEAFA